MAEVLRTDAFGVTDNFFELGGHSLSAVTLSNLLTERCGQVVPLAAIFQYPTVEGLAGLLARGDDRATQSSSLLVELQPGTTRPPIFWIHPVGGTVFCYAGLARALGPDQPFYAFQSPGLEPGTTPISNLEALCRHYADLLQSRYPHGRVRLGGWSLGGIVAFELARQLVARGRELEPVVLVNSFLLPGPAREPTPQDLVHAFLQHLRVSAADIGLTSDADWNLDQTFDALLRYAKHVGVIPQSVGRDPLRRYFDVFSANVRARREYCARSYSGDVVLFHVADASTDKLASWDRLTGGRIRTIPIPGKHAELMSPPHVHTIATQILALMGSHG
jgi:thioesterase domain-containing protein